MSFAFRLALILGAHAAADKVTLLPPLDGKSGDAAAWIVLPGAYIDDAAYKPLGLAVQAECSMPLWVAILGTSLTPSPIPPEIGPRIDYVLKTMRDQGLDLGKVRLFYGGHSLGSVFIQDHLQKYHGDKGPMSGSIEVLGQVLMGGFVQRKYAYPSWTYPVSTLTIGGELDGLARPTRLAEAYFQAQDRKADFPVVILQGVTHNQFASGDPVTLVKARDLQPEVSYEAAHTAIAKVVAPYFEHRAGMVSLASTGGAPFAAGAFTDDFVKPIIEAYQQEGSRWMGTPAQFGGPGESDCKVGGDAGLCPSSCPWAPEAQKIISDIDGWSLQTSNAFVKLSSTPIGGGAFHLPNLSNDTATKTISISTFSQNYWDDAQPSWFDWKEIFDSYDTGFIATSALEIGTKLASRQCTFIRGAGVNKSFDVDKPDFCKQTNEKANQWALQRAGAATKARFQQFGEKFVFAADVPKQGGPLWLDARLAFDEVTGDDGEKVLQVASPMQKTEIDYWQKHFPFPRPASIPDPGCYHYCKLLSPARAMEWIYVDSLRLHRSIANSTAAAIAALV